MKSVSTDAPSPARTLAEIAQMLDRCDDSQRRLRETLRLLENHVQYDRCALLDATLSNANMIVLPEQPADELAVLKARLTRFHDLLVAERAAQPDSAESEAALPKSGQKRQYLAVPLVASDSVRGLIYVERTRSEYTLLELSLLSVVAAQIAAYITILCFTEQEAQRVTDIQAARAVAETANRTKDEFLTILGHELRTPLAAVRNAIVVARRDEQRRERALDIARHQAEHLGRLIDDLLDVSSVTQGKIRLSREPVYVAQVVEHAVEAARPAAEQRGHHIVVRLGDESLRVHGDQTRLEQIIANLLGNALKYTPPGGRIDVEVELEQSHIVLRVRDNGTGIAPEMLERIFDLFVQANDSLDQTWGLGIGLTLTKRLVELHGGHIEARSAGPGQGAEFVVWLPALPAVQHDVPSFSPLSARAAAQLRVLLAEDNQDAAEALSMLLELLGHEVHLVNDGASAVDAARADPPDVALIDIGLPKLNGYEVAEQLRQLPSADRTVLIALTGYGNESQKKQAFSAGFHFHLTKPVALERLEGILAEHILPSDMRAKDQPGN
jgi:signal transduction histidine kinase/ActR/RegA family two-component response regulator